jgi:hypothetical protein
MGKGTGDGDVALWDVFRSRKFIRFNKKMKFWLWRNHWNIVLTLFSGCGNRCLILHRGGILHTTITSHNPDDNQE